MRVDADQKRKPRRETGTLSVQCCEITLNPGDKFVSTPVSMDSMHSYTAIVLGEKHKMVEREVKLTELVKDID